MRTEYSDRYIVLGLKIAYYRKKAGFTQEVFAEKTGKNKEQIIEQRDQQYKKPLMNIDK